MLSRRNIRVKVMQMLYAYNRDRRLTLNEILTRYHDSVRKSYELYLFNVQYLISIAEYSVKDAGARKIRLLHNEEDKFFTPRLLENECVQSLLKNKPLQDELKLHHLPARVNEELVRNFYAEFAKHEEYRQFWLAETVTNEETVALLLNLYKFLINNELYRETMEDNYYWWDDDESLVVGAMKKTIKALPNNDTFWKEFQPQAEHVKEFGETVLRQVYLGENDLIRMVEPILRNWAIERVAVIDMVLIQMALCEFMYCSSVPPKVTINEFVEISKSYSTEDSKEFINGILDRLMKKLEREGKIFKEGRGLME